MATATLTHPDLAAFERRLDGVAGTPPDRPAPPLRQLLREQAEAERRERAEAERAERARAEERRRQAAADAAGRAKIEELGRRSGKLYAERGNPTLHFTRLVYERGTGAIGINHIGLAMADYGQVVLGAGFRFAGTPEFLRGFVVGFQEALRKAGGPPDGPPDPKSQASQPVPELAEKPSLVG
jgi:hypothetical protein